MQKFAKIPHFSPNTTSQFLTPPADVYSPFSFPYIHINIGNTQVGASVLQVPSYYANKTYLSLCSSAVLLEIWNILENPKNEKYLILSYVVLVLLLRCCCRNPWLWCRLKGKCKSVLMSDDDHICFVMLPLPPRSSHFLRFLLMVLVGVGLKWTDAWQQQ